ncbi:hypothetical protein MODO_1841 [Myroides odoratimimus]|nr:hypothetical protein HMPREF9713_03525 [Myroides odoratimimus CCUG 12700]GAQ14166.1 hypothetical protein MODO_1841 [Myroides odoratimimus]SHM11352.1 hypothetical protein SAMN05444275_10974 [Myroides odoratimimus subsp. xuanwuensis]
MWYLGVIHHRLETFNNASRGVSRASTRSNEMLYITEYI